MFRILLVAIVLFGAYPARAAEMTTKIVTDALHKLVPSAKIQAVTKSSLPGFYSVVVDGHVVFVSSDGKYLVEGHVYNINTHGDLAEEGLAGSRRQGLTKIPAQNRLTFAPPHPKYRVTVFTDVDCPYCREFHKQIAEYNKLGIAVDYVLFPLSIHPGSDKKAETVWCSNDRHTAYNVAMSGKPLAPKTCTNPIAELNSIAMAMGINGTPTILADDGTWLGGYVTPQQLAQRLAAMAADRNKVAASN
ncbi:MAG: DsbC family protein [Rudaea sp.]